MRKRKELGTTHRLTGQATKRMNVKNHRQNRQPYEIEAKLKITLCVWIFHSFLHSKL